MWKYSREIPENSAELWWNYFKFPYFSRNLQLEFPYIFGENSSWKFGGKYIENLRKIYAKYEEILAETFGKNTEISQKQKSRC